MSENQYTITNWGRETFGSGKSALEIAARMQLEVAELLQKLGAGCNNRALRLNLEVLRIQSEAVNAIVNHLVEDGEELACPDCEGSVDECADIDIMLVQVVSALGGDAQAARDLKMERNRRRTWARLPNGTMQHVEEA